MPSVYPFRAAQYRGGSGDLTALVAPPYDVLDAAGKSSLLAKDARNVVGIDLPHTPAKQLGPPEAYAAAGETYRRWLSDGTLTRRAKPALFVYRQTFTHTTGQRVQRSGVACCVETVPFGPRDGGGILPHEETFSGPKEDRLALMKATRAQLSPIFGLFADDRGRAHAVVKAVTGRGAADATATTPDGTLHEAWAVEDDATIRAYQDALAGEDVFIADGHHRYNTALNYIKHLETQGAVPSEARRCMMVLVGMSDPGLVIWPTHRVIGGMNAYSFDEFLRASARSMRFEPVSGGLAELDRALNAASKGEPRAGLFDFATRRAGVAVPTSPDPLAGRFPSKPAAWRQLDVSLVQYSIVEDVCQAALNGGRPVTWAFPHTIREVEEIGGGAETGAGGGKGFTPQLAVLVRPTPLSAVRAVSKAGELMPQKSTFFYPKLATGLWINPLE